MFDIHSHYLPGIDDGAKTEETSLAMLEMAAENGTTHIVGTPHCNYEYKYSFERNQGLMKQLQEKLGDRIQLSTGCDFHLSFENLRDVLDHPSRYTINQGTFLLTEFGNYSIPPSIENEMHQLRLKQLVPIITHPERIPALVETRMDLLKKLVEMGCPLQVTAGSLTGRFGKHARELCFRLLDREMVHMVASDAHNTQHRSPRLKNARKVVAEKYGEERAQALFVENPRAAIESQSLPYYPYPTEPLRKKRFWFF